MADKNSFTHRFKQPNIQVICAVLLFSVSAFFVRDNRTSEIEKQLFDIIYNLPEFLTPLFAWVTHFGSFYVLVLLALLYFTRRHYRAVIRLLMSGSLAYLLSGVAKDLVGRPRPLELFTDVVYRDFLVRGTGFPSGHMALATAVGLTLTHILPRRYSWVAPLLIIGVGLSRIHLGVHAPLDVVGGFAIGWVSYALFRNVQLRDMRPSQNNLKKRPSKRKLKSEV